MSDIFYYEAGYGKRIGAYLIDSFIVFIPPFILGLFFSENQTVFLFSFVMLQILSRLYFILMNKYFNGTLGKKLFNLKIINYENNTKNLTWKMVILRQLFDIIVVIPQIIIPVISVILINNWEGYKTFSFALKFYKASLLGKCFLIVSCLISLAEIITMLINDENRSLHDLLAKTVVIEK